jgi:integrase
MADRMTFRTYYDEERARHHIAWKFPTSVQAYTGEFFTHTFRKGIEPTREMLREQIARYHQRIYEAAPIDSFIAGMEQTSERTRLERQRREVREAERAIRLTDIADRLKAIQEQIEFRRDAEVIQAKYGVAIPMPALEQVSFDQALKDLKSHDRHQRGWRNEQAEKDFDQARRRAWESLSAFAKDAGIIDHTNMAAIPRKVIQAWSDSLNPNPGAPTTTIPHDYTADVVALYAALKRKNRITKDDEPYSPAEMVHVPFRPPHKPRRPFPSADAKRILEDARHQEPVVRWLHWFAAFMGLIPSEFVEAHAEDIKLVNGHWVLDMEGRLVKTPYRQRVMPIRSALTDREGFLDFVASRKGRLFDETAEQAEHKVRKHLLSLDIEGGDQVFYSWRHSVLRQLEHICGKGTSRCDYLAGHAQQTIRGKHYTTRKLDDPDFVENELPELVKVIERLRDPSK